MAKSETTFAGSIPENYDRYLVPLIFDDYAADLVARLELSDGARILETACGTGVVTRHLRPRLPAGAHLTATDLNAPMIDIARRNAGEGPNIAYRQADATDLPFDDGSFDAVICQFGVMFLPDKAAGFREALRVLKPGGRFLFNVWDSLDHNAFPRTVHAAVAALFPADPPNFLTLPYGYHDISAIKDTAQSVGFGEIDIAIQPRVSRAPGPRDVANALAAGTPLANQIAERAPPGVAEAVDAAERAIERAFGNGPVNAPMQAFQISARAPAS